MAKDSDVLNEDTGLTDEKERVYLNFVPQFFGQDLPWVASLRAKYRHTPKPRDREHPWFKSEFDEMEKQRRALGIPNDRSHYFRVYWLAARYECSEAKVLERIVQCCNFGGTRYAADVYRFGTDYRFDWLSLTGERKATGLGYARGLTDIIRTPEGVSPKAGMSRPIRRVPSDWPRLKKKLQVPVQPFRYYVQERAVSALQNAPEVLGMAQAYWSSKEPESKEMTRLWGSMLKLILETDFVFVAINLVPVEVKRTIARLVVLEAAKLA